MKKFLKIYKSNYFLLLMSFLGILMGIMFKEKIGIIKPLGDLFLNLLLTLVIPLILFTVTSSIIKIKQPKRLSKIIISTIVIFIVTSIIAASVGLISTIPIKLVNEENVTKITEYFEDSSETLEVNILERMVNTLSVDNFSKLLTHDNMIALIIICILLGLAINMAKEKGKAVADLFESFNHVIMKLVDTVMYYAPTGLFCYFAAFVGTIGSRIAISYLKVFIIYLIVSLIFYFGVYSLYVLIAGGKKALKLYWKNILPATLTALGTCSSAASMPVNIENTEKMNVPKDIASTTISLGTTFHKDGSCIGSVFKIMFLVSLFGMSLNASNIFQIIGVALIATLLVVAVPIGGGTISELLIISLMGFPVSALPILTIIAIIIDEPATLLNVVGDSADAMLVTRIVEGKDWIDCKEVI